MLPDIVDLQFERALNPPDHVLVSARTAAVEERMAEPIATVQECWSDVTRLVVNGVLKHRETYEILRPEDVGQVSSLVLGKHSGRHALRQRLEDLGHAVDDTAFDELFAAFKLLADRKKEIHDEDLQALMLETSLHHRGPWELEHLQTTAGTKQVVNAILVNDGGAR